MRVLIIGSGGREHALAWKIAQSKLVDKIFCAPGNGGILEHAECVDIKPDDTAAALEFAKRQNIDLTVVGPEAALAAGIVDEFNKQGMMIFGPSKKAAQLESSKVFSKELMAKYDIPTADFKIFDNPDEALKHIEKRKFPCVVKADGLAQGKGVIIAKSAKEAKQAVSSIMHDKAFGDAGNRIIVEDCLIGEEASIIVLTDSKQIVALASSQDHKRIFDNDKGPNTGGMGAYSPAPVVTAQLLNEISDKIIAPTIAGLRKEGIEYKGVLYVGIMVTKDGPKTLEFNVRFGDPETQAILPRLKSDLVELMIAVCKGKLSDYKELAWDPRACVCIVCASAGYPGKYEKGKEIFGLDIVGDIKDVVVFHAGTRRTAIHYGPENSERYFTDGGRVLGVTGLGNNIKDAIASAYHAVNRIRFDGMQYRSDIAKKAL